MSPLQGALSSLSSPLIVFLVYVTLIGANTLLGFHYKLHEHLTFEAISQLIFISLQATTATILSLFVPMYVLTYGLRAARLDPDILVVPLAGAAGHLVYMVLFVNIHNASSCASVFLVATEVALCFCYFATKSSASLFPIGDLLPAIATTGVLSMQFATINSAVYEKYPKIELIFAVTGFFGVIHASHVSSRLQVDTARCIPYTRPESTLFGTGHELLRVALSVLATPFIAPLLFLHSELINSKLSLATLSLCMGFALIWLPMVLLVARWSNHFIRHYYGKYTRAGCPTIASLELMQHLVQTIVYVYIMQTSNHFS